MALDFLFVGSRVGTWLCMEFAFSLFIFAHDSLVIRCKGKHKDTIVSKIHLYSL